jgi:hypothetical protein
MDSLKRVFLMITSRQHKRMARAAKAWACIVEASNVAMMLEARGKLARSAHAPILLDQPVTQAAAQASFRARSALGSGFVLCIAATEFNRAQVRALRATKHAMPLGNDGSCEGRHGSSRPMPPSSAWTGTEAVGLSSVTALRTNATSGEVSTMLSSPGTFAVASASPVASQASGMRLSAPCRRCGSGSS